MATVDKTEKPKYTEREQVLIDLYEHALQRKDDEIRALKLQIAFNRRFMRYDVKITTYPTQK